MKTPRLLQLSAFLFMLVPVILNGQSLDWTKYTHDYPGFKVKFPSEITISIDSLDDQRIQRIELVSELESMLFGVHVQNLDSVTIPAQMELYYAKIAMEAYSETMGGTVLSTREYNQNGIWGMETVIALDQGGYRLYGRFFARGEFIYHYYAISLTPHADIGIKDKFFKSFKVK